MFIIYQWMLCISYFNRKYGKISYMFEENEKIYNRSNIYDSIIIDNTTAKQLYNELRTEINSTYFHAFLPDEKLATMLIANKKM